MDIINNEIGQQNRHSVESKNMELRLTRNGINVFVNRIYETTFWQVFCEISGVVPKTICNPRYTDEKKCLER